MKLVEFVNAFEQNAHSLIQDKCLKIGQAIKDHDEYVRTVGHNNGIMEAVALAKHMLAQAASDDQLNPGPAPDAPRRLSKGKR